MADIIKNPKVDEFLDNARQWKEEFGRLRTIILACQLTEELKWGVPCYTYNDANIVLIHGFKEYCAVLFVKGALLKDTHGILIQQTANVQAGRQIRFTGVQEIAALEATLIAYIDEAVKIEKSGLEVSFKKNTEFAMPEELLRRFAETPAIKTAFEALTPGRQRAYLLHFSEPRQSKTREARIEKNIPQILKGKGLND
ncbi:MAG: YdeI/OmpD-associated family protein [Saccharofermentanales bacterium]